MQTDPKDTGTGAEAGATRKGKVSLFRVFILLIPALAIFLFVLYRHIPHGHQPSPKYLCYINLRTMAEAKATWALVDKKFPSDVPQDADLFGKDRYIVKKPVCPKGAT